MTEKELRRLSRGELIEMLYCLKKSEAELQDRLAEAEKKLQDRSLRIEKAGSIAEAALSVNEVLEAAQKAADRYLEEIVRLENEAAERRELLMKETERQCRRKVAAAEEERVRILQAADEESKKRIALADDKIADSWRNFQTVLETYRLHELGGSPKR